ncbi:PP2C family protein-serine/threonine phosphatase [Paracoccus sp. (in: a-proteobacteria)]|uniref:PP2C family protein-serine/threonine phosphatase n=1 Tax=Paracoccus sp. TaxID=267 RepID=UPI00396C77B5
MQVVIADDDAMQRVFASSVVSRMGYQPLLAEDGLAALRLIEESGASILLCDLDMPGLNGHEVTRRIRQADLGRYIHIIMLTATDQAQELHRALEAGVDDFMTKPLNAAVLKIRIRAAVRLIEHEITLSERNRALEEAKQRIEHDLDIAAEAQRRLLPDLAGRIRGCRFASAFVPSAYVSGDMFGCLPLSRDLLGFYAIDVAGHGVHAALMSVAIGHLVTTEFFASLTLSGGGTPEPAALARELNLRFYRHDGTDYFTMFCGILDQRNARLHYCQAGYPSPILAARCGRTQMLGDGGYPVGLLTSAGFESQDIDMQPGQMLVLCSDGVSEAENANGEAFGDDRLQSLISRHAGSGATAVPAAVVADLAEWRRGRPLEDDLTVFALERSLSA